MAGLDMIPSLVGVAGEGVRLSLYINAISCEIANAPPEIHQISKTVSFFALTLKQAAGALKGADSVHSRESVETIDHIAHESERVFAEINGMLEKIQTKRPDGSITPSVQQRFKWCFKKSRVNYLVAQLDSLKLSLSLMVQIMQLGKLMAATSRFDSPEEVKIRSAAIQQERMEAQNLVILRFKQNKEVDRLFQVCEKAENPVQVEPPNSPTSDNSSVITIEPPPEYKTTALVQLPLPSLGEIDQLLNKMDRSPKDMIQTSDQVIGQLLEKWTRWHEVREKRHNRQSSGKYVSKVDSLYEDDDTPRYSQFDENDENPRGFYIEGTTTNWRQPHSAAARQDAARRRKQYMGYQPSVSAASSDVEDSAGSSRSRRNTKRHIINSSSESSDSEQDKPRPRKDSGTAGHDKKSPHLPPPVDKPVSARSSTSSLSTPRASIAPTVPNQRSVLQPPPQLLPQQQQRPYPSPDQQHHHSMSTPLPPLYTHNSTTQFATSPTSPAWGYPPTHGQLAPRPYPQATYPPPPPLPHLSSNIQRSQRPVSRDGKRSPSRLSFETSPNNHSRRDERYRERDVKRKPRDSKSKVLREGATKGLIGAGAIAGFLEALEGLSL